MTPKPSHALSISGSQAAPFVPPFSAPGLILKTRDTNWDGPPGFAEQSARRTRIWEFGTNLHCSIVGTCLSTAELRHVLEKLRINGVAEASDHDLHCMGVVLAGQRDGGAKFLQKALDRRHRSAIARYSRAKEPSALLDLWEDSLKQGDIPGAYWAVLTHPSTTEEVVKRVFGDGHMLSHLVGAANRADIRRLCQLEQENAALAAKVERQQRQLREGFGARDRTIRQLNDVLARQARESPERSPSQEEDNADGDIDALVHELNRSLERETARRERSERRAQELLATLNEKDRALQARQRECASYRQELEGLEKQLSMLIRLESSGTDASIDLSGLTLLYVGARAHQIPQLKHVIEQAGARFLHHDGGIERSSALIPGLISRADRVLFPVDCISHDAVVTIKRLCRVMRKTYEPLRTASLSSLFSALARISGDRDRVAAE